jgi:hypothetical protein
VPRLQPNTADMAWESMLTTIETYDVVICRIPMFRHVSDDHDRGLTLHPFRRSSADCFILYCRTGAWKPASIRRQPSIFDRIYNQQLNDTMASRVVATAHQMLQY